MIPPSKVERYRKICIMEKRGTDADRVAAANVRAGMEARYPGIAAVAGRSEGGQGGPSGGGFSGGFRPSQESYTAGPPPPPPPPPGPRPPPPTGGGGGWTEAAARVAAWLRGEAASEAMSQEIDDLDDLLEGVQLDVRVMKSGDVKITVTLGASDLADLLTEQAHLVQPFTDAVGKCVSVYLASLLTEEGTR